MKAITLPAHFDGEQIRLDEPYVLEPDTKLLVTVLPKHPAEDEQDAWSPLATAGLAAAYGSDEPEYSLEAAQEQLHILDGASV